MTILMWAFRFESHIFDDDVVLRRKLPQHENVI